MSEELIRQVAEAEDPASLAEPLRQAFTAEKLRDGSACEQHLGEFVWALESDVEPYLYVDDKPAPPMQRVGETNLWIHHAKLLQGWAHAYYYRVRGDVLGDKRFDKASLGPDSYPQDGVPQGKLSEKMTHASQVYHGYKVSWWVYASPGVDPGTPAPVMNFLDGHRFLQRDMRDRLPVVVENLVRQKKIPPMVCVLVAPTQIEDPVDGPYNPPPSLRSLLYDSVNDDYNKMIFGEIFPKVETMYKLRSDGYSIGSCGQSSGGIGAFNMAWQRPEQCSRVLCRIGTFTSIQWRYGQENENNRFGFVDPPEHLDGGNIYPFLLRKRPKKNLRVWLSDGSHDLENAHGSWPLQNIQMANSLKMEEYDFHLRFGNSQHNTEQGAAELPEAMTWLWRDYDPAKTSQEYVMDPDEKSKPYFRVGIVNR